MTNLAIFVLGTFFLKEVFTEPTNDGPKLLYDQRQTGRYNIHFNIKDVAIIAVGKGDYRDNDKYDSDEYYYDENDLTVKPENLFTSTTTSSPTTAVPDKGTVTTMKIHDQSTITAISQIQNTTNLLNFTIITSSDQNPQKDVIKNGLNQSTNNFPYKLPLPLHSSDQIPVHIVMEPVLTPKDRNENKSFYRWNQQNPGNHETYSAESRRGEFFNHKRISNAQSRRCHRGQVMDQSGHCRTKRSSFLEKLLTMLSGFGAGTH